MKGFTMLKIAPNGQESGPNVAEFAYIDKNNRMTRQLLRLTRWLRAIHAEKYFQTRSGTLLDIGCGDGYFLRRQKNFDRVGLDLLSGDKVTGHLDFPDNSFDIVTMLAVIEHLSDVNLTLAEIARVLKPDGRLIFTTPKRNAEFLINLYSSDIEQGHHLAYYDLKRVVGLAGEQYKLIGYATFIAGLNQVFCLEVIK
jgi:ubiquinone/menaquinone biosynthesis C-methylase UbiE